jgi:small-conductance mechanosensitive channel
MMVMAMKPTLAVALALLAALAAPAGASAAAAGAPLPVGQQKAPAGAEQKAQERKAPAPPAPAAIPVPEIVRRAEEAAKLLREFDELAEPPRAIDAIQARLPEVSARLGPELESTIETLKETPQGAIVDRLQQAWRSSRLELVANVEVLTKRATQLEDAMDQLAALRARWTQARADAQASRAPAAVVQRVDAVLADIEATRARLQAQRAATLVLQDRVAQEVARCEDALARIVRFRQGTWMLLFVRTTPPIWSLERRGRPLVELPARAREAAVAIAGQLHQFVGDNAVGLFLQGLVFIGLICMARAARRRARALAAAGEEALPAAALFERPYSSATVAALVLIVFIFPERPRVVTDAIGALVLLPVLRVVRPLIGPAPAPALYALAALCLTDRIRAELAVVPLADQAFLLLEMLGAVAGLAWLLGSGRLRRAPAGEPMGPEVPPARRAAAVIALAVCAGSFAAAAYGAMELARKLGANLLFSALVAIIAYAAVQVADGLLAFALRVWPLRRLGMVERHRYLLERRGHRLFCWFLAATWAVGTLRFMGVLDEALALGQAALGAEVRRGTIGISLGDVLAFVITVWLAFLLSAGIRFVLEEDVYPRLHLTRGLPYVISSLLHYAILFLGFLLAVGALGVDLNKVTLLAGAFGVGLGFGLQGVVNNFVSGLIVLFERPISVGDAIQMGDLAGEVRRIGIRATTVRNWEGAEVIVPNASLVSERVTNWTHTDRLRRMDVPVGVAYGSAPEKVLELLLAVARAHPAVLAAPAPLALFLGFGESALNFELRAWTSRFDQWVVIRSELSVAVYAALRGAEIEIPLPQREVRLREGGGGADGRARAEQ